MVSVIDDDFMVCVDCLMVIANGDYSGLANNPETEDKRTAEINAGLESAGGYVAVGSQENDLEFSSRGCNCCGCGLAGSLHHCVVLR